MASKPHIVHAVPPELVPSTVPAEFRGLVSLASLKHQAYTVLAFQSAHGSSNTIVDSRSVARALGKTESGSAVVAVGHNFTAEARALLETAGVNAGPKRLPHH